MKKTKTDSNNILQKLSRDEKARISLYVSKAIYKKFQAKCKGVPASQVVEALMLQFIDS